MQTLYNIHALLCLQYQDHVNRTDDLGVANTLLYCLKYRNTCMLVMINFNSKYINADLTSARVKHNNRDE